MDTQLNHQNRQWNFFCWNVHGINSQAKLTAIRSKVLETKCEIIYLQETKWENFDAQFIK
jgi:exonuclease III